MVDETRRTPPDLFSPQVQFLLTDVQLGITFARLACAPEHHIDIRQRNYRNAQRAYETVERLSKKTPMSDDEKQAVRVGLEKLRKALEEGRRLLPQSGHL